MYRSARVIPSHQSEIISLNNHQQASSNESMLSVPRGWDGDSKHMYNYTISQANSEKTSLSHSHKTKPSKHNRQEIPQRSCLRAECVCRSEWQPRPVPPTKRVEVSVCHAALTSARLTRRRLAGGEKPWFPLSRGRAPVCLYASVWLRMRSG